MEVIYIRGNGLLVVTGMMYPKSLSSLSSLSIIVREIATRYRVSKVLCTDMITGARPQTGKIAWSLGAGAGYLESREKRLDT